MHEQLSKCSRNVLLVLSEYQLTTNLYQDILSVISYAVSVFLLEWRTTDMDIEMGSHQNDNKVKLDFKELLMKEQIDFNELFTDY